MGNPDPKFAPYGSKNECARTNTLLLLLSDVSTGVVSLASSLIIDDLVKSQILKKFQLPSFIHLLVALFNLKNTKYLKQGYN